MPPRNRKRTNARSAQTRDGYINPATRTGRYQDNLASAGHYAFKFWTRNRVQLEAAYRGSWIIGNAVDCVAEDMTRAGIDIVGLEDTKRENEVQAEFSRLGIWSSYSDVIKWSRLYGGSLGILLVDGQDVSTPLNLEAVGKDQFRGIYAIDRWITQPDYENCITDIGPQMGNPVYYQIVPGIGPLSGKYVHHSRVIRMDGIRLPIYQRQYENGWGMSIVERIFDALTAYDSATMGAAQLVYTARLRVMKVKDYKKVLGGTDDRAKRGLNAQMDNIRMWQTNEGMTVIDSEDDFNAITYAFAGLSDILTQFGQQISGAIRTPMTRLFGQSPAGFSTGESDLRQYHEGIAQQQEMQRPDVHKVLDLVWRSKYGTPAPEEMSFKFAPLMGMTADQKAEMAAQRTNSVVAAFSAGLVGAGTALKELKAGAEYDGAWNTISEDEIAEAENEPPSLSETASTSEGAGEPLDQDALTLPVAEPSSNREA
ncbi:DUF1073 domain-containing protein [Acetobacter sicerae]|uniref:DUF1073 domain-containing protein n=1 Tax=Acetobacter sicerae TaxID=85325 RepID=UPI00156AB08D|nr:DUF1073 domain-containing protein [Acetobacter sicerae]NHN93429.1 DUF1073 domain-containing protein [Acetobacter sicerae]